MITEFRSVSPSEPLRTAAQHVLAGFQQDFPVVEDSKVVGVLTRDDLLRAIATEGIDAPIGTVMRTGCEVADPSEMLETVLARLQSARCRSLPVIRRGVLVGMLTLENIGEFMMLQAAVRKAREAQVPAPRTV
jgi:predicted transcriptional regulator